MDWNKWEEGRWAPAFLILFTASGQGAWLPHIPAPFFPATMGYILKPLANETLSLSCFCQAVGQSSKKYYHWATSIQPSPNISNLWLGNSLVWNPLGQTATYVIKQREGKWSTSTGHWLNFTHSVEWKPGDKRDIAHNFYKFKFYLWCREW